MSETKTKHTPGPWVVWKGHAEVYAGVGENTRGGLVGAEPGEPMPRIADCEDISGDLSPSEQLANAKLIAAAPDLLNAATSLVNVLSVIRKEMGPAPKGMDKPAAWLDGVLRDARAVIAKAEGR